MGYVREGIINTKIVITSMSAFSYLHAVFKRGKVFYPSVIAMDSTDFVLSGWDQKRH
jgi:hypothetical protein